MSRIVCPRTASGLCSPRAQSTASVMFDLPHPFGPTITLTPGEKTRRVRSGNDLKPLIEIELRCMAIGGCVWALKACWRLGRDRAVGEFGGPRAVPTPPAGGEAAPGPPP